MTGGEDVTRQQQPRLYNLLENLCISRGIPMPKLKIMDSDALNAFATGLNPRQYAITVTSGLLKALNDQEIEAVLGHELTHIRNGDVQMMVVAVIIAGVVGFFGELFFRSVHQLSAGVRRRRLVVVVVLIVLVSSSDSDSKGSGGGAIVVIIIAVALIVLAWLLSQLVQAGAVAVARIAGRRRIGRTDQEPRRHDLGAAQDREPRRASRRDLGGDGIVRRQPARGLCRPVRDPSFGGVPGPGAGAIRRRTRSRTAGAAVGYGRRPGRPAGSRRPAKSRRRCPPAPGAMPATPPARSAVRARSLGQSGRPMGPPLG